MGENRFRTTWRLLSSYILNWVFALPIWFSWKSHSTLWWKFTLAFLQRMSAVNWGLYIKAWLAESDQRYNSRLKTEKEKCTLINKVTILLSIGIFQSGHWFKLHYTNHHVTFCSMWLIRAANLYSLSLRLISW